MSQGGKMSATWGVFLRRQLSSFSCFTSSGRQGSNRLTRNMCTSTSESESATEHNRRRAMEYLQRYSNKNRLSPPTDSQADAALDTIPQKQVKPTAREVAHARLQKHIPVVTGSVPPHDQLVALLEDGHGARNIAALDVRHKASFADWLLVCCGLTSNHVLAIADGIAQDMRALDVLVGGELVTVSGRQSTDWMVVDIGTVVIHIMTDEARDHYRLEELWLPEKAPQHHDESDNTLS